MLGPCRTTAAGLPDASRVILAAFSRPHLLPAQTSVIGRVTLGIATNSSMVSVMGLSTRPLIVILWLDQVILGTAPWLRT